MLRLTADTSTFGRARVLLSHFEQVTVKTRSEALKLHTWVKAHRQNRAYWPLLALCGLVLNGLSLNEEAGPYPFPAFLVDMPRLFESFITAHLSAGLKGYGLRAVAQRHDYLDVGRHVGIRPDILVYDASGTKPLLVIDAKYRQLDGEQGDLNRDLYQVSAYMDRYKLSRGMLIYPQWERPGPAEVALVGTPKEMYIANLDLSAPTPAALDEECAKLAAQVAALARQA
jgi:5-methylcytosine-specific restriction endonuclease McrBC regulatory subunit McrC